MQAGKNISANKIFSDKSDSHPYRCVGGNGLRGYTENFNSHGHYSIIGRQGALCGCVNIEKGKFYATEHAVVVDTYEILSSLFIPNRSLEKNFLLFLMTAIRKSVLYMFDT